MDAFERQIKASIVALNKASVASPTLVEAIDHASLWPVPFDELAPMAPSSTTLDALLARSPLLVCAIASEIGFRFEGVGTVFWAKFTDALGLPVSMEQRQRVGEAFDTLALRYKLSRPSESAFSAHFSIMSWPLANALLPLDLVGPVSRMIARGPVGALPLPGRSTNFTSLRAWASAAEGARLADWLRFEAPAARVVTALLTENRASVLSATSYTRLRDAVATVPEAFFAARSARLRARTAKPSTLVERSLGRLAASRDQSGIRLFVSWPALPTALFDEARVTARAAGWRPQLWGGGGFLHPDMALSTGPFALSLQTTPAATDAAYPDAATIFGPGSDGAAALAARTIDWTEILLFDANYDRTHAEQRFDVVTGTSGHVWIATKPGGASFVGLRMLGSSCGYNFFEADLSNEGERAVLTREDLFSEHGRLQLARHPLDSIGAPQGVVRPTRPFILYMEGAPPDGQNLPQMLAAGSRRPAVSGLAGQPNMCSEPAPAAAEAVVDIVVFERDRAFEALVERRLQLRVESRLPLKDVPVTVELEIAGVLIARGHDRLPSLPLTVSAASPLLSPLYEDAVRTKLLETGKAVLRLAIARSAAARITLERAAASVEWLDLVPHLIGADSHAELVCATANSPHRFTATSLLEVPTRGAAAFGLRLADGRIADPIRILTSNIFDLGDLSSHFSGDLGSRRMFDNGRGVGDIARGRVAWARALCTSLAAIGAKTRIVRQFEEPLVYDLCGENWYLTEQAVKNTPSNPHEALWAVAIERSLVIVPEEATQAEAEFFAASFQNHAGQFDPDWPRARIEPADGAMDDALNAAFSEVVTELHTRGELLEVENDFDFGSPAEDWEAAAAEALRRVRRTELARLIAPSEGGRLLSRRSYAELGIAELAEDLSGWTRKWALPRGQLTAEAAAASLQLWVSPAACDDVDAAIRVLVADPFVSRATRYTALRLGPATAGTTV
ncbi:hypothetical protein [Mesorhizobium sp. B2-4-17]|uniref:hypothetical protein n=1 Tax=Mesorhizobium sp. B2-4-17 TaxID=2589932 RepID=UPI0011267D38|nr:hypothetical protein [Mesorhizobium sp. B2-4-17]TPK87371.1 hypothetical protein FJ548_14330 [Mesorhizobium sp. B2-4-17]